MCKYYLGNSGIRALTTRSIWGLVGLILVALCPLPTYATGYRLVLLSAGTLGADCVDSTRSQLSDGYLAGMYPMLIARILPADGSPQPAEYAGVTSTTWPAGLQVMAGYANGSEGFTPDAALTSQLQLQFYVDRINAMRDSLWRQTGKAPRHPRSITEYHFRLHLDPSMAGQQFALRATYDSDRYGHLDSGDPVPITVFAPCSARDTMLIREDVVERAFDLQQWERVLALTDSLAALRSESFFVLSYASIAATTLGLHDQAIAYLDRCFERYGTILPSLGDRERTSTSGSTATDADRRTYERRRSELLEAKAERGRQQRLR